MGIPSQNTGLIAFLILTLTYFGVDYATKSNNDSIVFSIYIILLLSIQFAINISLTSKLCGEPHVKTAFLYTLLPWLLIFGMLNLMLLMFPGWLRPFSNTIGYFFIRFFGLKTILDNILKSKESSQTLGKIYDDYSLLINEIPNPKFGYDNFWEQLKKDNILNTNANNYKEKLRDLVNIKFMISKFTWFLLSGILTISTSYNYIVKSTCNASVKEMKKRYNEYQQIISEQKEKNVNNERTYVDTGH